MMKHRIAPLLAITCSLATSSLFAESLANITDLSRWLLEDRSQRTVNPAILARGMSGSPEGAQEVSEALWLIRNSSSWGFKTHVVSSLRLPVLVAYARLMGVPTTLGAEDELSLLTAITKHPTDVAERLELLGLIGPRKKDGAQARHVRSVQGRVSQYSTAKRDRILMTHMVNDVVDPAEVDEETLKQLPEPFRTFYENARRGDVIDAHRTNPIRLTNRELFQVLSSGGKANLIESAIEFMYEQKPLSLGDTRLFSTFGDRLDNPAARERFVVASLHMLHRQMETYLLPAQFSRGTQRRLSPLAARFATAKQAVGLSASLDYLAALAPDGLLQRRQDLRKALEDLKAFQALLLEQSGQLL